MRVLIFLLSLIVVSACSSLPAVSIRSCQSCSEPVRLAAKNTGERAAFDLLVNDLRQWIKQHAPVPLTYDPRQRPDIKYVDPAELSVTWIDGSQFSLLGQHQPHGQGEIKLSNQLTYDDHSVSYLLHELVHNMQYLTGWSKGRKLWQMEKMAYELQIAWLKERGKPTDDIERFMRAAVALATAY